MNIDKNKEFICLLTQVVCEMFDDSDNDDELMPLKAVLESEKPPSPVITPPKKEIVKVKKNQEVDKYSLPSRFEDPSIFQAINSVNFNELICKVTMRPTTECLCTAHINLKNFSFFSLVVNQKGGESISEMDFKANWHISKSSVETLYHVLFTSETNAPVITAMEFLAFLWSLATNETADAVETRFKLSKGEIPLLERKVYDVLLSKRFTYERWPRGIAVNLVGQGFKNICGFSGVLGVVDCVHFPYVGAPYPGTYQNRSNEKTVVFELACDHRGIFTYSSYFWWPGKWMHTDVHRLSTLSNYPIPEGSYLIANRSYALIKNFVTPYAEPKKPNMKQFNEQHLMATNVMKNAIAGLATRFKAVSFFNERTPWVLRKRFASCILLHNLCTELEGPIDIDSNFDLAPYFPRGPLLPDLDVEGNLRRHILSEMVTIR